MNSKLKSPATRSLWETHDIDTPKRIPISLQFTKEEFQKIQMGLIPMQMEDKWFIFYEEGWLYFHRSWTGFGIYKTELVKEGEVYCISEFQVERNTEKYSCEEDDEDRRNFIFLIYCGLLGVDSFKMPMLIKMHTDAQALGGWSMFGNMLFGKD